jgi:hypothetical protein
MMAESESRAARGVRIVSGLALALALNATVSACGSKSDTTVSQRDTTSPPDVNGDNQDAGPVAADAVSPDASSADATPSDAVSSDMALGDAGGTDVQDPAPDPGTFGAACNDDQECNSGHCVPTPAGLQCTKPCFEDCPAGWACSGVSGTADSVTFVCLHRAGLLCQPCRTTADCNQGVAGSASACVSRGDAGSFCALACESDAACPSGYACADTAADGKRCLPTSGECQCNPSGVALGMATDCRFTNTFGTCGGARSCTADGLSACEGEGATAEVCDNIDNDCDGRVDEDIPQVACETEGEAGRCGGVTSCTSGATLCVGQEASTERCNGLDDDCDGQTDDDFADSDGDRLADCVDPDDDNDGSLDPVDCAPLDGSRFPGATEVCNGRDDDCDLLTDEQNASGCRAFLRDADGDAFGATESARCLCGPDPASRFVVEVGGDCNDLDKAIRPGGAEVCNAVDDDCDGQTDEAVASPCGGCDPVCVLTAGDRGESGLDPSNAEQNAMVVNPDGSLSLATSSVSIPFIWIANSPQDTVSKLDTSTGREVGRYIVCDDPSRTAVDLNGDAIVACRGDGRIMKIAIVESDCIDRNGNGRIDTSRDLNNDGVIGSIASGERVAADECILWNVVGDPSCGARNERCGRAAGVDKDNNVWAGFYGSQYLVKLDGRTGAELKRHNITFSPYGLAIAGDGTIWVASRGPMGLGKVHPELGQQGFWPMPASRYAYGMAIDHLGRVWVATGEHNGVSRFDPDAQTWTNFGPWDARGRTRGIAVRIMTNAEGGVTGSQVFIAHHAWLDSGCTSTGHRHVTMLDATTGNEIRALDLGGEYGPVGVAVASDGMLWTCNQCTSNATRINPDTGVVLGNHPVGANPYTYSDMTGYALRTITARSGYYRQTFRGWDVGLTRWSAIFLEADLPGDGLTFARIRYRVADSQAALAATPYSASAGPFPPASLPLEIDVTGRLIEVEVTLGTDDPAYIPTLKGVSVIGDQL